MKLAAWMLALFALSTACEENDECRKLQSILKSRKEVLTAARAQAGALEVLQKRSAAAEAAATKLLRGLWLSEPESKVHETIEKRAKAIPGATIERTTTPVNLESGDDGPVSETMWVIRFHDASMDHAFSSLDLLSSNPPLVRIATFLRDKDPGSWRVELLRAAVDQVPINPQPLRTPAPEDLSKIPKQIGFCGADKLRSEIGQVDEEIRSKREDAERTTVLLPATASWDGLRGRAELVRDIELENRRHLHMFRDVVLASALPFKGLGVEGAMVFLEVFGGKKELQKIEQEVARRGGAESLQIPKGAPDGVVRVGIANTIESARRSRAAGERQPEGVLPADHPDARARTRGENPE